MIFSKVIQINSKSLAKAILKEKKKPSILLIFNKTQSKDLTIKRKMYGK